MTSSRARRRLDNWPCLALIHRMPKIMPYPAVSSLIAAFSCASIPAHLDIRSVLIDEEGPIDARRVSQRVVAIEWDLAAAPACPKAQVQERADRHAKAA